MPLLQLNHLSKRFPTPAGSPPLTVLDRIDLSVDTGERVAVIGPSGCGKSTLLNLIGALDVPSEGSIDFDGQDLATLNEKARARFRNREIGFVFQEHHLLPQCTAIENVLVPGLARHDNDWQPALAKRADQLFERAGLSERRDHFPSQLSGGERQRVAVVRALINGPRLLLADEPTGSLDRDSAASLAELLVELNRDEKLALILVTHDLSLAERAARVYRLEAGRLVEQEKSAR